MQVTADMLSEAFCQTQREILALDEGEHVKAERFRRCWERMAELVNEKLTSDKQPTEVSKGETSENKQSNE